MTAPAWLTAEAKALWDEYAPGLIAKKVLTAWDAETFGAFCDAAATRRQAVAAIAEQGEIVELPVFDRNGKQTGHRLARNPWVLSRKEATEAMVRVGARYGMSPSDRAQLRVDRPRSDRSARVAELLGGS